MVQKVQTMTIRLTGKLSVRACVFQNALGVQMESLFLLRAVATSGKAAKIMNAPKREMKDYAATK